MKKTMLTTLAATAAATAMSANLMWVGGAEGDWNDAENWDPQQVPTNKDTVFFDSSEAITVNLVATQIFATLSVSNTPCLRFVGDANDSELQAQQDSKWTLYAPIVFDENTYVKFLAGKVWTNNSTIDFLGGVGANNSTPTLGGTGLYKVRGPVDFPSGVNLAAPIDWNPSSVTDATFFSLGSACDWQFNATPTVEGHLVRFSGGTGGIGGSAPFWVKSSDAARPSAGFNQYANPTLLVKRTMPTVFEDWLALCLANACNNNKVGFTLGSGANLWIPAEITTANSCDFSSESPTGGFKLVFQGCGADVRLTGDNSFQGGGATTEFICGNGCGYNSVEIDGADDTVHPFGAAGEKLYTNTGHGVFLRPMRPGLTLANGLLYGNSVNNNNAYTFGFDGTNDLTVAGDLELGTAYSMIPVIGDMTLTLTGTLNPKDKNFDFAGTGDVVLGPTSEYTGTTGSLVKHSSGTLTLQGALAGTSYNRAYFSGGKTILDYTQNAGSRLNTANSASLETPVALADALRLRSTELVLKGGAVAETVGEGNGTTIQNGLTKIRRDGGTSTIYLGALSPAPTGAQAYTAAISYQEGVAQVAASQAGKLLGGNHMVGDHFAKTDADGFIVAAADNETGDITTITGSQTTGRLVNNLFVIEPTEDGQSITLSSATAPFVANWNGMIFRGSHDFTVTGGQFGGTATWNHSLVFNHVGTGVFTIDSELYRNGFTKIGPGTVRITGTSTLGQSLNLYEGVFEVASATGFSPASKGNYVVYLNGGTLKTSVDVTLERPLSVGDNGGVIEVVPNTTFTQTANTVTTADNTSGPVVKRGGGVWLPSGDFQAQSELRIEEGTVRLGSANGIGDSTVRTRSIAPTKILADGTLDVAGFNAHVGNLYLQGGRITDSATGGSLGAYTFFAESGVVDVPLTNVRCPNNGNYLVANNLEKSGPGMVTLSAANEYTGTTFVRDGVLELTGS
ncbi:MAG: autotransporter-associated beta strand repeat-containing protein, partial [Kiritimatiellae bacterium]|nr:autotransporter-associated beta strand repeat-containing protein [Kiritimatiellia bacterium]